MCGVTRNITTIGDVVSDIERGNVRSTSKSIKNGTGHENEYDIERSIVKSTGKSIGQSVVGFESALAIERGVGIGIDGNISGIIIGRTDGSGAGNGGIVCTVCIYGEHMES